MKYVTGSYEICNTGAVFPGLHIWLCQLDLGDLRKL